MPKGLLFICLGNSCRSIMAEALARHLFPDTLSVASAGLQPLGYVAEETLLVLAEAGIPTAGLWSKGIADVNLALFPLVVNLTEYAVADLTPRTFQGKVVRHPVVDPFGHTLEVYREARQAIRRLLTHDLPSYLPNI
jgi:protein-tyrosine-phosphatase